VLNCFGTGNVTFALAAIDWINANRILPAVVNMSFGSLSYPPFDDAVRNSIANGITYVVSAGNDSQDASTKSPAEVAEAITVAATDSTDVRYAGSNFGPLVDLFAPGVSITSDFIGSTTQTNSNTSFAAPHVTGAAALYLELNPGASPATVRNAIVAASTKNVVVDAGPGSPNALLFVNFPAATVTIGGQEQYECIPNATTECGGGVIFDTGTVSVTVAGRTYSTSYGRLSTPNSIASALANAINSDPAVTASSSGAVITLVSRTFSCYSVSTSSSSSMPLRFDASFWGTISGPACP
jgi:subtilisin family serine protease